METIGDRCPLCGTELSQVKFKEIEAKLSRDEQVRASELSKAESAIRLRLEQQFKRSIDLQRQEFEKKSKEEVAAQIKKITLELDRTAKRLKDAEAREVAVRKQVTQEAETARKEELLRQRQILEHDKKLALVKQQAEFTRQGEALQKKVLLLEKQIQKKTANELGDGAEIDLYEALREVFSGDKITRVRKGQPGADIIHEVLYKGSSCGKIITDSKNHQGWQNAFVTKLRQDRIEAGAEHAILATTVFPAGKKEMCIESGVIVVSPARVVYVTQLLRNAMVTMHVKGLSMRERSTKMSRLYELITSESYSRKLAEAGKLAEEILDLDVQEKKAHDNVWKKRGSLAKRAQNVLREAETEVAAVIESSDESGTPPAYGVKRVSSLAVTSRTQEIV